MKIDKFEIWVHDRILKNENVRHFLYGAYQRALYLVSEKVKCEGRVEVIATFQNLQEMARWENLTEKRMCSIAS